MVAEYLRGHDLRKILAALVQDDPLVFGRVSVHLSTSRRVVGV